VAALLPLGVLAARWTGGAVALSLYLHLCTNTGAPALAAWWPALVLRERLEGDGRELLYVLQPRGVGTEILVIGLLNWVLLIPFVVTAHMMVPGFSTGSALPMLARSFAVTAVAFVGSVIMQSSALGLLLAMLAAFLALGPFESGMAMMLGLSEMAPPTTALAYFATSLALFCLGEERSRRFSG